MAVGHSLSELLILASMFFGWGLPASMPPLPADLRTQQAAPSDCLFYVGFAGTAQPDSTSKNHVEQLLAEKQVQTFVDELTTRTVAAVRESVKGNVRIEPIVAEVPALAKELLTHPVAVYGIDFDFNDPTKTRGAVVVNFQADLPRAMPALQRLEAALAKAGGQPQPVVIAGEKFNRLQLARGPRITWGFHGNLFVLAAGAGEAEALVARLNEQGELARWLVEAHKKLPVVRPAVTTYLNLSKAMRIVLSAMPPQAAALFGPLGTSHLESYTGVSGLDATGAVTRGLLKTDGQPVSLVELVTGNALMPADIKAVPKDAVTALVLRCSANDIFRKAQEMAAACGEADDFAQEQVSFEQSTSIRVEEDLLKPLGDAWALYSIAPGKGNPASGLVLSVALADQPRFVQTNQKFLILMRASLNPQRDGTIAESQVAGTDVFRLESKFGLPVTLTWAITDDRLIVTLSPATMQNILERGEADPTLADVPEIQRLVAGRKPPCLIAFDDTGKLFEQLHGSADSLAPMVNGFFARERIPFTVPTLPSLESVRPHLSPTLTILRELREGVSFEQRGNLPLSVGPASAIPLAGAISLPWAWDVPSVGRTSAGATTNLKQIALAMHNHIDAFKRFPAPAIRDKQDKPLLSWRVKLLPYLDEAALYRQFHLDEPWDSPHNRPLIARMPKVFADPDGLPAAEGKTRYLLPTGKAGLFADKEGPKLREIADGTSKTIMIVEAAADRAVVWTKPDDLEINDKDPLAGLKSSRDGGFLVSLGDGSVRSLSDAIDLKTLRLLFTPNDRQPVNVPDR